jgi:hypothetical protein
MLPCRPLRVLGTLVLTCLGLAGCALDRSASRSAPLGVTLTRTTNDVVTVAFEGKLFTEYHYRDVSRPFLYPLLGARGEHFSRRWPQETVPGEEHDHPHHHALWWAHGDANGVDFWSEEKKAGRTVHQSFADISSGKNVGVLTTRNRWIAPDGKVIASDERTMRFHRPVGTERIMDFEITVFASEGDLTLGDTKEGSLALRLAESMRLTLPDKQPGAGHIVNSAGVRDGETWGKRAEWVDYYGPVDGRTVGIAIFDHPTNPRHPTWWHVRDYGLFAANPFGLHDFEKREKGAGNLKIAAGSSVTFRYRFYFHDGDTSAAAVAAQYDHYVKAQK